MTQTGSSVGEMSRRRKRQDDDDEDMPIYAGSSFDRFYDQPNCPFRESGVIEAIHLKNFMCHGNFSVNFSPNLNFILGANGSGKSAVVAALQCIFGASASLTERGGSLSDLIQEKQSESVITVRFSNRGPNAFQYQRFGHPLVLQRRLKRNAGSDFAFIDSEGKRHPLDSGVIAELRMAWSVNLANPVSFMTQEQSKRFGNASDRDKYQLFFEASGLAEVEQALYKRRQELAAVERDAATILEQKRKAEAEVNRW